MEKTGNLLDLLDYTKVDALDYEEQIELLEEKLGHSKVYFCGKTYTVYEDKETFYIDDHEIGIAIFDKSYSVNDALITLMTNGQEQSLDFADYQSLDDIYNSSLNEYTNVETFIEFVKEVSERNHLYFDIHREDNGRGGEYYIISDGERELKVDGCGMEFVEADEDDDDDDM